MAKAAAPKKVVAKKDAYKVEGDKLVRTKPVCPKCGPGVFMATHKDQLRIHRVQTELRREIIFNPPPPSQQEAQDRRGETRPGTTILLKPQNSLWARSIAWIAWGPPEPQTRVRIPTGPPDREHPHGYLSGRQCNLPDSNRPISVPTTPSVIKSQTCGKMMDGTISR